MYGPFDFAATFGFVLFSLLLVVMPGRTRRRQELMARSYMTYGAVYFPLMLIKQLRSDNTLMTRIDTVLCFVFLILALFAWRNWWRRNAGTLKP